MFDSRLKVVLFQTCIFILLVIWAALLTVTTYAAWQCGLMTFLYGKSTFWAWYFGYC